MIDLSNPLRNSHRSYLLCKIPYGGHDSLLEVVIDRRPATGHSFQLCTSKSQHLAATVGFDKSASDQEKGDMKRCYPHATAMIHKHSTPRRLVWLIRFLFSRKMLSEQRKHLGCGSLVKSDGDQTCHDTLGCQPSPWWWLHAKLFARGETGAASTFHVILSTCCCCR